MNSEHNRQHARFAFVNRIVQDRGLLFLIMCYIVAFPLLMRPFVHGQDPVGYYSWLRSAICDYDLNVANEFEYFRAELGGSTRDFLFTTPTGYRHNQWSAGPALLWSPFFIVAHIVVVVANGLGAPISPDGYGIAYEFAASLGSSLYGLLAVVMTYRMARHMFGMFVATLTTWTVWFASPLIFYMLSNPLMSHACDTFAVTLVLYIWWTRQDANHFFRNGLFVGMAIGLATWIRTQNAPMLMAPSLLLAGDIVLALRRQQYEQIRSRILYGFAMVLGFLCFFIPLMIFWKIIFGAWIANTYATTTSVYSLDWSAPYLLSIFFSSDRGMFVWTPITLVSLIGLWWFRKHHAQLTIFVVVIFLIQLYIISCWFFWAGAVSFGPRFWTNMFALFTFGFGAVLYQLRPHISRSWLIALGSGFVLWNMLLLVQYALETVPRYGPVDIGLMVKNQFLVIPQNINRIIQALIERN